MFKIFILQRNFRQLLKVSSGISILSLATYGRDNVLLQASSVVTLPPSHSYDHDYNHPHPIHTPPQNLSQVTLSNQLSICSIYFSEKVIKLWNQVISDIQHISNIFLHVLYLGVTMSPAIILLPTCLPYVPNSEKFHKYWWQTLISCISNSGPCLMKFAQWVSTRPDLFPHKLCLELQKLQSFSDHRDPMSSVRMIEMKNWNIEIDRVISDSGNLNNSNYNYSPVILGGGCVAQVLKGSVQIGDDKIPVAIKVIQPGIKLSIDTDIDILRYLSWFVELIPGMHVFSLSESVEEFAFLMKSQLDLRNEAHNLDRFRHNFRLENQSITDRVFSFMKDLVFRTNSTGICDFPQPIYPYVSSDVLVETYEEGVLISEMIANNDKVVNQKLAQIGLSSVLKMIFDDNFVHADLHPGNIIVKKIGTDNYKLCMIDAGLVATLDLRDRKNFIDLFHAIVLNKGREVGQMIVERSRYPDSKIKEGFLEDIKEIVADVNAQGLALEKIGIGALMQKVLVTCYKHQVRLESKYSSVIVALGVVEGLGRQLDKDVDILKNAIPYILKAYTKQME